MFTLPCALMTREQGHLYYSAMNSSPGDGHDQDWTKLAREEMDAKAKPPGSLGALEDWAVR